MTNYAQLRADTPYVMLYAAVTAFALTACCYLLFRQGNAFAGTVTPPARLRRLAAALFAVMVVNHVWYMGPIFFLTSGRSILMADLVGGLLDCLTFFPLSLLVLLSMLQDRRRPLWPVAVLSAPLVMGMLWSVVRLSQVLIPLLVGYLLFMSLCVLLYIVRALRQYGRWLYSSSTASASNSTYSTTSI